MPVQANITKFFRPIASSSVAGKNGSSKKETLENRSPNKSLNLETPEKISSEEEMKVKKRKLEDVEESPKSCLTPGTLIE